MKETILITGGSGLLAVNWALSTRDQFKVILGLHRRIVSLAGIMACQINFESVDSFLYNLEDIKPKLVIHTAGMTNIEECEAKPDIARFINVDLAINVAKACDHLHVPLVHISTDHLFSGDEQCVKESHPVAPQNVYGKTKAEAELRVLDAHSDALVIRTNFFGWGPSYRQSFSDLIIDTLRGGREVSLFEDVYYTPILIESLIEAVNEMIGSNANGIYNVVGDERISKYLFGIKVADQFALDVGLIKSSSLSEQTELVRRPKDMSLSNQKARDILGRKLGSVNEHLMKLYQQEKFGFNKEVKNL